MKYEQWINKQWKQLQNNYEQLEKQGTINQNQKETLKLLKGETK